MRFSVALPALLSLVALASQSHSQAGTPGDVTPGEAQQKQDAQPASRPARDSGGETPGLIKDSGKVPETWWFQKPHKDFGSYTENTKEYVTTDYHFENKSGTDQKILNVMTSCKCQRLKFYVGGKEILLERNAELALKKPIVVKKGQKGRVNLRFDISGGAGPRSGDIRIETTDPKASVMTLTAKAMLAAAYKVTPEVCELGRMAPSDQKEWSVEVRCVIRKDWQITRADKIMPNGMKVTSIDRKTDAKGGIYYQIRGTYGPDLDEGAFGGYLLFHTDDPKQSVSVTINADVRQRIHMTPRFLPLGRFKRDKGTEAMVYVWASDGKPFKVKGTRFTRMSGFKDGEIKIELLPPNGTESGEYKVKGRAEPVPAKTAWRLHVVVAPNVTGRMLRGQVVVEFEDKSIAAKDFTFNGFPNRH